MGGRGGMKGAGQGDDLPACSPCKTRGLQGGSRVLKCFRSIVGEAEYNGWGFLL